MRIDKSRPAKVTATEPLVWKQGKGLPVWPPPAALADPPPTGRLSQVLVNAWHAVGGARTCQAMARKFEFVVSAQSQRRRICGASTARFAILCYHRVGRGGVPIYSGLPRPTFEAQIQYLRKHYRIVSLSELLQGISEPWSTQPSVAITFDDGYADLYTEAFPILRRYSVPATIFLTVGSIESGQVAWYDRIFVIFQVVPAMDLTLPLNPPRRVRLGTPEERLHAAVEFISLMRKLPVAEQRAYCESLESGVDLPKDALAGRMLSWERIREMHRAGISFGAHTMTHSVVSRLSSSELEWELGESKRLLEQRLQHRVLDFAFPFGKLDECSEAAIACLARLGYRSASTTVEGLNRHTTHPFALRRVSFGEERSLAMFAMRLNRLFLFPDASPSGASFSSLSPRSSAGAVPGENPVRARHA